MEYGKLLTNESSISAHYTRLPDAGKLNYARDRWALTRFMTSSRPAGRQPHPHTTIASENSHHSRSGPLLDAAGAAPGTRLLDVACGPGYVAAAAARRGASVIGVDFASAMVDLASRQHSELEFQVGDAEKLDFVNDSFDAVVMNFGMLHLANPEAAIAEAFRVLRPGGRYAFTVWDAPNRAVAFGIILDSVQLHGTMDVPLPPGPPFFRFSDSEESTRTLAGCRLYASANAARFPRCGRSNPETSSLRHFKPPLSAPLRCCVHRHPRL
jgi:SAM-dependent methyltransferase